MSNTLVTLSQKLADKLEIGDGSDLIETLKGTAFKGQVTDAQMAALLVVSNQYGLNPWTREIYAFPDKNNGIVPVVGVDGWARIINNHPQFDGMDFEQDDDKCTCIIYRKDRTRPVKLTEYMNECRRNTPPWQSHPRRMLRHKTMIQCARIAFGYGGIFDADEATQVIQNSGDIVDASTGEIIASGQKSQSAPLSEYPTADFARNVDKWASAIASGKKTFADLVTMVSAKAPLSAVQRTQLQASVDAIKAQQQNTAQNAEQNPAAFSVDGLIAAFEKCTDYDEIIKLGVHLDAIEDPAQARRADAAFSEHCQRLSAKAAAHA